MIGGRGKIVVMPKPTLVDSVRPRPDELYTGPRETPGTRLWHRVLISLRYRLCPTVVIPSLIICRESLKKQNGSPQSLTGTATRCMTCYLLI